MKITNNDFFKRPASFMDLQKNLELCDRLFLEHQSALMHKKNEQALHLFGKIYNYRMSHLSAMENILLPAFEKIVPDIPKGAKKIYFLREKKLIERELKRMIRMLSESVLHNTTLDLLHLFEEYVWLKDLLDHHDAREKTFLLPTLQSLELPIKSTLLDDITLFFESALISEEF
jgi:hypothetical protein